MSDRAHTFKLGLFTLAGLVLLLGFLVVLGAGLFDRPAVKAETYTKESVQGLDVGAPVKFRGVRVGKVTWIGFVAQKYDTEPGPDDLLSSYVLLRMDLDVVQGEDTQDLKSTLLKMLKQGLHVRVAASSLVGPAYLEFVLVDRDARPEPLTLAWTPKEIYVPSTPSLLSQITTVVEQLAQKLNKIDFEKVGENLNTLLTNTNAAVAEVKVVELRQKIEAFLDDAKMSSARVKAILDKPEIDQIVENIESVTASLNSGDPAKRDLAMFVQDLPVVSAKLRDSFSRLEAILKDPKTERILSNLDTTMTSTPGAAEDLRQLLARINGLVAENRQDVARIVQGLKDVLRNAGALTEDAQANPSRLIFGEPPPRTRPGEAHEEGNRK